MQYGETPGYGLRLAFPCTAHFTFTRSHLLDLYEECFRLDTMPSNPCYLASRLRQRPVGVPPARWLWSVHHKDFRRL